MSGRDANKSALLDAGVLKGALLYGVLPTIALVAVRFPEIGRLLLGWWEPLASTMDK
jgi:hypothetical protein